MEPKKIQLQLTLEEVKYICDCMSFARSEGQYALDMQKSIMTQIKAVLPETKDYDYLLLDTW